MEFENKKETPYIVVAFPNAVLSSAGENIWKRSVNGNTLVPDCVTGESTAAPRIRLSGTGTRWVA